MESLTDSRGHNEGVRKAGPRYAFFHKCIFNPVPSSDLKNPKKYGIDTIPTTEAINVFLQMSLKVGGLPFPINRDPKVIANEHAVRYLEAEYRKGLDSAKNSGDWTTEEDVRTRYKRS